MPPKKSKQNARESHAHMNVLLVTPSLVRGGGAEKNAAMLANALGAVVPVTLLTFQDFDVEYPYVGARIRFSEPKNTSYVGKLSLLFSRARKIKKLCQEQGFTHVISFMEEAGFPLALSKVLGNKAYCVTSLRTHPRWYETSPAYARGISFLYPKLNAVVVQTKDAANYLVEKHNIAPDNINVIANILEASAHVKQKIPQAHLDFVKSGFIFGTVGRLSWEKNHVGLISSFAKVVAKNPAAKLVIVGDGPLRDELDSLITVLKLEKHVLLAGVTKDVPGYLALFDCFVFTSSIEGFPNGILEAVAAGLPIVSTDCRAGPRDILCPSLLATQKITYPYVGEYGTLVPVLGDSHAQHEFAHKLFADVLLGMMKKSKATLRTAGLKNKRYARFFSPKVIAQKWLKVLQ